MKKIIKIISVLLLLIIVFACQTNENSELESTYLLEKEVSKEPQNKEVIENDNKLKKSVINLEKTSRQITAIDDDQLIYPAEFSIIFKPSVSIVQKNKIRQDAINKGYIESWKECDLDPNIDIWIAKCCIIAEDNGEIHIKTGNICDK